MSDINATKIATNLSNGYVDGSTFVVSSGDYRYDVYKILPNVSYTVQLSENVGNFLACFVSTVNPETADSNFFGKVIKYIKNPEPNSKIPIKYLIEEQEGKEYYLVLYKDDSGLNNVDTRVVLTGSDTRQKLLGYRSPKFNVIPTTTLYNYLAKNITDLYAISEITELGNYALAGAPISEARLNRCTSIGPNTFSECSSLRVASFPACSVIKSGTFYNCSTLREAYFPVCQSIGKLAFTYCSMLESVYLLSTSICSLSSDSYAFSNTGIDTSYYLGYFGSVFVRVSLLDTYKANNYWSYYSDRLVGLTDSEIEALPWYESSHFA